MMTLAARYGNTTWINSMFGGLKNGMTLFSAAQECAAATREHRSPSTGALQTLGIDETAFRRAIGRR